MSVKILTKVSWLVIALIMVSLTACGLATVSGSETATSTAGSSGADYQIDPLFADFHASLETVQSLGPAIAPLRREGVIMKQYVYAGLMLYDPRAAESDRYRLAPLGLGFDVETPPVIDPNRPNTRYVNGHTLYGDFLALYESLGGARVVGRPLSEENYNPDRQQYEQYFENLGFYRPGDAPNGPVRLMAYGAAACVSECGYKLKEGDAVPASQPLYAEPFNDFILRLGGQITGKALTDVIAGEDGRLEIIFENLVVVSDETEPAGVGLRSMAFDAGVKPGDLVPPMDDRLMEFVQLQDGLGHNVPVFFMDYLRGLGGLAFSGMPVTEVKFLSKGLYEQCFTKICLRFQVTAAGSHPSNRTLYLAPLGKQYKERVYDRRHDFHESQSLKDVEIRVWEKKESLNKREMQVIHAAIFEKGIPLPNREPILKVTHPDQTVYAIPMPPTDGNGHTFLILPPIKAPNNTLIPYEVCLHGFDKDQMVCKGDNFLIWNSP